MVFGRKRQIPEVTDADVDGPADRRLAVELQEALGVGHVYFPAVSSSASAAAISASTRL